MPKHQKIRFVVNFDGHNRQLFSATPTNDGTVIIGVTPSLNMELEGENHPINDQGFSIHPSAGSKDGGFTIKGTVDVANAPKRLSYQYVREAKESFIALVYAASCPVLTDRKPLKPKQADIVFEIARFVSGDLVNLVYCLFVTDDTTTLPALEGHSVVGCSVGKFRLWVYYSFSRFPAFSMGSFATPMTSLVWIEDTPKPNPLNDGVLSLTIDELPALILDTMKRLAAHVIVRLANTLPPAEKQWAMSWRVWFHRTPIVPPDAVQTRPARDSETVN